MFDQNIHLHLNNLTDIWSWTPSTLIAVSDDRLEQKRKDDCNLASTIHYGYVEVPHFVYVSLPYADCKIT